MDAARVNTQRHMRELAYLRGKQRDVVLDLREAGGVRNRALNNGAGGEAGRLST